jgi:hypothetical protein
MEPPESTADLDLAGATKELHRLRARWQCLTQEEGKAIAASRWDLVLQHQTAKKHLQAEMTAAARPLRIAAEQGGANRSHLRNELLPEVEELIRLESHNRELLAGQLRQARARFLEMNQATFNLLQVRQAYARGPNSIWHSYS